MEIVTPRNSSVSSGAVSVRIEWSPGFAKAVNRELGLGGRLQRTIDEEVLEGCKPYTPFAVGTAENSSKRHTVVGSGLIVWEEPYIRYIYYGKLMVDPITKKGAFYKEGYGFWSRRGVKKERTDIDLKYQGGGKRGKLWCERWKTDNLAQFEANIQREAGEGRFT